MPFSESLGRDYLRNIYISDYDVSENAYDISGGAALDADNVPLGCMPIALLYENAMDI